MSREIVVLKDHASGAEARILASQGFNAYQFRVEAEQPSLDVLWAEPGFEQGDRRPSGSGIPLLFPYPGRLRGKEFAWEGVAYPVEGDDGRGNAIHGFVLRRPWRVTEQSEQEATAEFHASIDAPELLKCWPADFRLVATYAVRGLRLEMDYLIENPDTHPLPCGFGTHPYFRLPLGGSSAADCLVELPVSERWELDGMLPTGTRLPVESPQRFRAGLRFSEMQFDDVFTRLRFSKGLCTSRIRDPGSGWSVSVRFDELFTECVVYTPPHREAVCIEPYTCVPNAAELQRKNSAAGLHVIPPGGSLRARVVIAVEPAAVQ